VRGWGPWWRWWEWPVGGDVVERVVDAEVELRSVVLEHWPAQ